MKNQIKIKTKKVLSLALAVLMVLTSWVWVAPSEAEALANINTYRKADKYGTPYWNGSDVYYSKWNSGGSYTTVTWPKHIYMDISETLQSAGYYYTVDWSYGSGTNYRIINNGFIFGGYGIGSGYPDNYYTMTNMFDNYGLDGSLSNGGSQQTTNVTDGDLFIGVSGLDWDGAKTVIFRSRASTNSEKVFMLGTPKKAGTGRYSTSGTKPTSFGGWQEWKKKYSWQSPSWQSASDKYVTGNDNSKWTTDCYEDNKWKEVAFDITIYDKSALGELVTTAEKTYTNGPSYTSDTWSTYQTAFTNAKNVLTTRATTQSTINDAKDKLETAIKGLKHEKVLVTYDNLIDFSKWNTSSASNGTFSDVDVATGTFTLTSNSGVSEGTTTSPLFPVTAGKKYKVDIDFTGDNWDVYIFFYGEGTTSGTGLEFKDGPTRRFSSSGVGPEEYATFTAPSGAVNAVIRLDANGSSNAVTFSKIRVSEAGKIANAGETDYVNSAEVIYNVAYGTLPTPKRTCYTFAGWVDANGNAVTSSTIVNVKPTQILYSTWKDPKHNTSNKEIINGYNATCTDPGLTDAERCLDCGEIYKPHTVIEALGHQMDGGTETPPTCLADGYITFNCLRPGCNYSYTKPGTPSTGEEHDWDIVGTGATCTEGSYDTYTCKLCGHTKTVSTGDPNGHMLINAVKTVAPTCTTQGYTTYKCSNCDHTEDKDFVPVLGHSWDSSVVTPPTCTEKGYTTHTCSICNETNVDTYVDATGHTYVGKITVQPSCKSTGIMTYTCHCGDSYEEIIPKSTDHNYVETTIDKPTCTETGTKNYICGCGAVRDAVDTVVPALGHDFSSLNWKVNVPGKDGSHHIKCSRCDTYGYINDNGDPEVGSLPHNFDTVVTPPTCTEEGYTTYTCFCGDTFRDDVVAAKGHSWNKGVVTDAPCCTKTGIMTYTCTTEGCGVTETKVIDAEGLTNVVKTEAYDRSDYCGEWGYEAFWTCNKCHKIYADEKLTHVITSGSFKEINGVKVPEELAVAPVDHDFTGEFICIESGENGKHAQKCVRYENCGAYDKENAADHEWNDGVTTDPTHLKAGETRYTCEICKDQYADPIDRLETHTFVEDKEASKPATCVTPGFTIMVCECGERTETEVPKLQHDKESIYNSDLSHPSTCLKDGEEIYTFPGCGCEDLDKYKILPATGHTFGDVTPYKAATCANGGAKGNEAYKQCETCKLYFAADAEAKSTNGVESTKTFEIAALQHTFFEGGKDVQKPEKDTLVSAATCTSPAVYKKHCDLCEIEAASSTYTYGDPIKHDFEKGELKANDNGTHAAACDYGCGTYDVAVECSYAEVAQHDEVNHKYVCACGNYTLEKHELPDAWTPVEGTDKLTRACAKCEYTEEIEKTQCVFNAVETTPATCTTNGVKTYTCTVHENCANNKTEVIPATGHLVYVESENFPKDKATCQADAVYYKVCEACGEQGTETWSKEGTKLDHVWSEWYWADDTHSRECTTCVGTISTESAVCSGGVANCQEKAVCEVCKKSYGDVNKDNHKTVIVVDEVPATCQAAGTEAYRYCDDCKKAIEEIVTIPALDHALTEWSKVEGKDEHTRNCTTCDKNADGGIYTETEACTGGVANCQDKAKCTVCKAEYGTVNKANHKTEANHLDEASVVAATCQKKGFSGNYVYDCCGEIKKAGSTTDALEHTLVEASKTPATCIAKGSVTYKCSKCVEDAANGLKVYTKTEELEINPKNHASEETKTVKDKEATCIEDGYTGDKYYVCCYDETKTESENRRALAEKGTVIKANGKHTYTEAVADYRVERIETVTDSEGNKTKNIVLKTEELTYDDMIASRHNDGKWYHVQLCTECYSIKYSACGAYEHTANCVETDICAACNGLCSLKKANVHKNIVEIEGTEATCTAEGLESYYKCEGCNKEFLDEAGKKELAKDDDGKYTHAELVIAKADHDFDTTDKHPGTGENDGKEVYRCKNYRTDENPNGCTAEKVVESDDNDGDDDDEPTVDDHEHVWSTDFKVVDEATCTTHGYEALYCTVEGCDAVKAGSYQQVTALGHAWNDGEATTAATCEAEGVMTYECTRCGETKTEAIEKLGHDWDDGVETKAATCKEAGVKTFTCKNDASHTYTESIAKGKHVVGDEIIRTEPGTCVKPAINWTACSVCGTEFSSEGKVDLTNHGKVVVVPGKEATCVSDGYTDAKVCSDCKEVIAESVEISHKDVPHHDHNGDGYCDECTFDLFDGSACDCICHKQNGLMKIIYKIVRFFWSIFGMNKSCRCGTVHY